MEDNVGNLWREIWKEERKVERNILKSQDIYGLMF